MIKYSSRFLLLFALILFLSACSSETEEKIAGAPAVDAPALTSTVNVTGGIIEGVSLDGIFSYKGIPFAAPPVAENRWRSPQPVIPWEGIKKADKFAPGPMQDTAFGAMLGGPQEISEDCLYLNVWTGAKNRDEKLPVMVWIYGGGFGIGMTSSPAYDGTNLAKKGVVLVSVAYRVGPMGFLAHPELTAEGGGGSGAYGIQDQIAGLKWVKDNISNFGGDPANVTIFGESAGGFSVFMLTASPMAKGLFHRAISESGGGLGPARMTLAQAEELGKKYLSDLGAVNIATARALSADEIQKNTEGMGSFWPVPDGITIPMNMYEIYETGAFNDTPVLIGSNSNEGGLFINQPLNSESFKAMVKEQYAAAAEDILKAYPHATDEEATQSAKDLMRESAFAWPTWAWAKLHAGKSANNAYLYYFDHRTEGIPGGANHAAEIPYVFANLGGPGPMNSKPATPADNALSELMGSYWINFAKTGDPNEEGLPVWPAFNENEQLVMYIDGETGARKHPDLDKIMAFDLYFTRLREETNSN
ncbi:MAG: carboxylesterase family protein [Deltaproteobacteria bacterium]|nr:carboxylesterase family protein [Deltaproteobacteria bacterium]